MLESTLGGKALVDSVVPSGVVVILTSTSSITLGETSPYVVFVILLSELSRGLKGTTVVAVGGTEALVGGSIPSGVVIRSTSSSSISSGVTSPVIVDVVLLSPCLASNESKSVLLDELLGKALVNSVVPSGVVVVLTGTSSVTSGKATPEIVLVVLLSP